MLQHRPDPNGAGPDGQASTTDNRRTETLGSLLCTFRIIHILVLVVDFALAAGFFAHFVAVARLVVQMFMDLRFLVALDALLLASAAVKLGMML